MEKLIVTGQKALCGQIRLQGSKNACLPLLGAAMLPRGESILHHCPCLSDVSTACHILSSLGCCVKREGDALEIKANAMNGVEIPEELMCQMRSSIVFLGTMLARTGEAIVHFPGGCDIGSRPIDLHIAALRKMGVHIDEQGGCLRCKVLGKRMRGSEIFFSFPSVGATENLILAAATAEGESILHNAAAEPEVVDLCNFLNACGAKIGGIGTSTLFIQGVEDLHSCEYKIIPDRIVAATLLCAAAVTGGELLLQDVCVSDLSSIIPLLEEAGCYISESKSHIFLKSRLPLIHLQTVRTMPYPGFPTDAQPMIMAMCCASRGSSVFVENIFENRYRHVPQLQKLGAKIEVQDRVAVVEGVPHLCGAPVEATDLRGGAALVIAALAAHGVSEIGCVEYIDRGYAAIEKQLSSVGADIKRKNIV